MQLEDYSRYLEGVQRIKIHVLEAPAPAELAVTLAPAHGHFPILCAPLGCPRQELIVCSPEKSSQALPWASQSCALKMEKTVDKGLYVCSPGMCAGFGSWLAPRGGGLQHVWPCSVLRRRDAASRPPAASRLHLARKCSGRCRWSSICRLALPSEVLHAAALISWPEWNAALVEFGER